MCTYEEKPVVIESNEPGKLGTDALTDGYNIFVDPELKGEEKDFAVSHEYYHYLQKMQQRLKSETYSGEVKVKNDPNEEEKANEFAIKNYKKVQNLVLKHINDREGTIKPKGEVYPLRINLANYCCSNIQVELNNLDMVGISTGGGPLLIPLNTIVDNATLQEKIALSKDMDLNNPETKLIIIKAAVRVWNKSNTLGETEDIVFEGHGVRGVTHEGYSKVVNMQGYMTPENIAEIVNMIKKPNNGHGRILLMGCHTADLVDNVSECLSNKFLVMGAKRNLDIIKADINDVFIGFELDAFLALTERERVVLRNFYVFCKYSIRNLIDVMNVAYEMKKVPEKAVDMPPFEVLKELGKVGEKLEEMGDATVLNCILNESLYNELLDNLATPSWIENLAMRGESQYVKETISTVVDPEKYIEYFESKFFHILNFDESDPYIYTRKPEEKEEVSPEEKAASFLPASLLQTGTGKGKGKGGKGKKKKHR